MRTMTDVNAEAAKITATEIEVIDKEIAAFELRKQTSNENFEILRKNMEGEYDYLIGSLKDRRAILCGEPKPLVTEQSEQKPEPEEISQPESEQSTDERARVVTGIAEAA